MQKAASTLVLFFSTCTACVFVLSFGRLAQLDVYAFSTDDTKALSQTQKHNKLFLSSSIKQGQMLVLSDALAVQSQGHRVSRSKGFKY